MAETRREMPDLSPRFRFGGVGPRVRRTAPGILAVAAVALIAGCTEPRPLQETFEENCRAQGLAPDSPAFSECMRLQSAVEQKRKTYQYIQRHIIDARPRGP